MKKLLDKVTLAYLRAQPAAKAALKDERGDTNFISIAIILIIVILIAVVFIGFGQQIKGRLETAISELFGALDA